MAAILWHTLNVLQPQQQQRRQRQQRQQQPQQQRWQVPIVRWQVYLGEDWLRRFSLLLTLSTALSLAIRDFPRSRSPMRPAVSISPNAKHGAQEDEHPNAPRRGSARYARGAGGTRGEASTSHRRNKVHASLPETSNWGLGSRSDPRECAGTSDSRPLSEYKQKALGS